MVLLFHNILIPVVRSSCLNRDQIFNGWAVIRDKPSQDNDSLLYCVSLPESIKAYSYTHLFQNVFLPIKRCGGGWGFGIGVRDTLMKYTLLNIQAP